MMPSSGEGKRGWRYRNVFQSFLMKLPHLGVSKHSLERSMRMAPTPSFGTVTQRLELVLQ